MKVAVTGSSGYLGQLVLQALHGDPAVTSMVGLDLHPSRFTSPKLTHSFADVRTADFARHFEGCDAVMHLAFVVQPPRGMSLQTVDDINIGGSRRVFQGAVAAGVKRIIHASSVAAYGAHADNPVGLTEEDPLRPNADWYYSRQKGAVERMLDRLGRAHPELIIIRFRPSIFLGPTADNTMGKMFAAPLVFLMRPHDPVDVCWDEDVAEAFRLGLHHDRSDSFNLSGAHPRTLREYSDLLRKRVVEVPGSLFMVLARGGHALGLVTEADLHWARILVSPAILVSAERARERLGWRPEHDAASALTTFARGRGIL